MEVDTPAAPEHPYMSFEEYIRELVRMVLRQWTALRLAVDQGMGGAESEDKAAWFESVIADYVIKGRCGCMLAPLIILY